MRHRLQSLLLVAVVALLAARAESVQAQDATPVPAVTNWVTGLGHWVNEEEQRSAPDAPWQKVASEWNNRMMPGGFFVETPGKMTFEDGSGLSWAQVWGYDPGRETTFSYWFSSTGDQGRATFQWNGRTLTTEGVVVQADGTEFQVRCTQQHAADARSMELTCERLTDGTWWLTRRAKGKRVD